MDLSKQEISDILEIYNEACCNMDDDDWYVREHGFGSRSGVKEVLKVLGYKIAHEKDGARYGIVKL